MIEILPATEALAIELAALMTDSDRVDLERLSGTSAADALAHGVRASEYAFCAVEDGKPLAMGGAIPQGTLLTSSGFVWLVTQPEAMRKPIAFLRHARRQTAIMRERFLILRNYERVHETKGLKWLQWLGFTLGAEMVVNGLAVYPMELRA